MENRTFDWLDRKEYPFAPQYFPINGQQLHYIDEGQGETLLFVHGTPSWSFDYRHLIKALSPSFRCIALDHIGFGLSDKPEEYDYSTFNHSATLEQFVLGKQLSDITLVVHDFGGPIGLHFALRHPERIKRIIVLNSWLWSSKDDPDYKKLRTILKSPLLPFLYKYLNFSPKFILPQSFGDKKIPSQLLRQYTKPFANSKQRNGALAFAHSLLHDQDWFEGLWQRREAIAHKPILLVWGLKDKAIKPHYLERFKAGFPNAQVAALPTCGHFPQEEAPEEVLKAILEFMQTTKSGQEALQRPKV